MLGIKPLFTCTESNNAVDFIERLKASRRNPLLTKLIWIVSSLLFAAALVSTFGAFYQNWQNSSSAIIAGACIIVIFFVVRLMFPGFSKSNKTHIFRESSAWIQTGTGDSAYTKLSPSAVENMRITPVDFRSESFYLVTVTFAQSTWKFLGTRLPICFGIQGTGELENITKWGRERGIDVTLENEVKEGCPTKDA